MFEIRTATPTTWTVTVTGEMFGQTVSQTFEGSLFDCLAFAADNS